ncbi:YjgF-like protein [Aspergillus ellipticus CBS 707.79]|uniref:YjgF-like protein n=1 Tax=Aspergillus ellipticus CBS 707.79 TaxID=1448320 RepID=A0A319CZH5_9EURO|nr:YjgF-like protein [Aspergillus ellipticus CBS 707.79]
MPPQKQLHATPSPYEAQIGYYRAIRHGTQIFVAGTTAIDPTSPPSCPQILFPGDAKQQTCVALEESIRAIQALGGQGAQSVVRVKMFVSRREDCKAVGEGFREVLGKGNSSQGDGVVGAVATMVVVGGFVHEDMLVEVEVDGVVEG